MKNLIEKISAYKRATKGLILKSEEFEGFIRENVPFEFWEDFGLRYFKNIGRYRVAIPRYEIKCLIPGEVKHFGKISGHDYNYCTSIELLKWSEKLPSLMEKAENVIKEIAESADSILRV